MQKFWTYFSEYACVKEGVFDLALSRSLQQYVWLEEWSCFWTQFSQIKGNQELLLFSSSRCFKPKLPPLPLETTFSYTYCFYLNFSTSLSTLLKIISCIDVHVSCVFVWVLEILVVDLEFISHTSSTLSVKAEFGIAFLRLH